MIKNNQNVNEINRNLRLINENLQLINNAFNNVQGIEIPESQITKIQIFLNNIIYSTNNIKETIEKDN